MASAEARGLIAQLRGQGLSLAEIERRLGQGRGRISQIALGKRGPEYGANLVPHLRAVLGGAEYSEPPRRTTAEGTPARVRKSGKTHLAGGNIQYETKRGYKTLEKEIERAGTHNKQVGLRVTARHVEGGTLSRTADGNVEVDIFSFGGHGGYDANSLMNRLEDAGWSSDPRRAIETLAAERGLEISGIRGITITTANKRG